MPPLCSSVVGLKASAPQQVRPSVDVYLVSVIFKSVYTMLFTCLPTPHWRGTGTLSALKSATPTYSRSSGRSPSVSPLPFLRLFFTVNLDGICSNSRLVDFVQWPEIGLDEANTSDLGLIYKMADTAPVPEDERRAAIMAKLAEAQAVRKKALVRSGTMVNSRVHTIAYLE